MELEKNLDGMLVVARSYNALQKESNGALQQNPGKLFH